MNHFLFLNYPDKYFTYEWKLTPPPLHMHVHMKIDDILSLSWTQTGLTLVVLAFVYMNPALTVRLNYGTIMALFNGIQWRNVGSEYSVQSSKRSDIRPVRIENQARLM